MKIDIRSHGLTLNPLVQRQIERRLYIALRSFDRHVDEVSVSIRDVNGPRGGDDLLGQVIVRFRRGLPIVVRAKDDSIHKLVGQMATAVRRAVKSRIRRRRTRLRRLLRGRQRSLSVAPPAGVSQSGEPLENRSVQLVT